MTFPEAIGTCLRRYADFTGRARRSEYWWFLLLVALVVAAGGLLDQAFGLVEPVEGGGPVAGLVEPVERGGPVAGLVEPVERGGPVAGLVEPVERGGPVAGLATLALLLPHLAVGARRLHDTGRSAWWLLLWLVPVGGAVILLVWFAGVSEPGVNQNGPSPLDPTRTGPAPVPPARG
ncbi:DUF805 domain-containing protein [Aquipuribacter sp. MA13-13]|uniref:DUF805 domain-containing protein n=1 Tax=Aquipuribacter sp. MA13-13 TaxID=3440840 RepID=UPI003EE8B0B9